MKTAFLVPLLLTALVAVGCSSGPDRSGSSSSASASRPTSSVGSDQPHPRYVVKIEGALQRHYALSSLEEFAASPHVVAQVAGRVLGTRSEVSKSETATVTTVVEVRVDQASQPGLEGVVVRVREAGGIVPVRLVRSVFEDKAGRTLSDQELAEQVDYRAYGQPHTQAGDEVLLWLALPDGTTKASPTTVFDSSARMRFDSGAGAFLWYGEPFNSGWVKEIRREDVSKHLD